MTTTRTKVFFAVLAVIIVGGLGAAIAIFVTAVNDDQDEYSSYWEAQPFAPDADPEPVVTAPPPTCNELASAYEDNQTDNVDAYEDELIAEGWTSPFITISATVAAGPLPYADHSAVFCLLDVEDNVAAYWNGRRDESSDSYQMVVCAYDATWFPAQIPLTDSAIQAVEECAFLLGDNPTTLP